MMNYAGLRAEQKALREKGIYRGIGFASFIEVTNPSAAFYGVGGANISSQDGATVKLDAQGAIIVATGVTEQGQGAESGHRAMRRHLVRRVDRQSARRSWATPTIRPMAAAPGPRAPPASAAKRPGRPARRCAATCSRSPASILQAKPEALDIRNGIVVDAATGTERLPLEELARIAYFRPDTLPAGIQAELVATRHYVPRAWPFAFTNGIQASYLEVDTDTGFVKLLKHWCVEDCGTIINPQLVDEQIRGGVVQGIGAALFEHCLYDERGQMLNGNMADYLVPMAVEMPDIECGHVVSPTADFGTRRQGRRRSRHRRRAGLRDERHQRRAAPARRHAVHRHAVHARKDSRGRWARSDQNLIMSAAGERHLFAETSAALREVARPVELLGNRGSGRRHAVDRHDHVMPRNAAPLPVNSTAPLAAVPTTITVLMPLSLRIFSRSVFRNLSASDVTDAARSPTGATSLTMSARGDFAERSCRPPVTLPRAPRRAASSSPAGWRRNAALAAVLRS